ncbi:hypothetical protein C0995_000519 [Termitomyces sp. Mi166|nr:hypothetical protein C0995_000519 [Termitomyces sp. Mi166\
MENISPATYQWQKPLLAFILATSLGQFCTGLIVNAAQFVYGNAPLEVMDTPISYSYYLAPSESSVYTYFVMVNGKCVSLLQLNAGIALKYDLQSRLV